MRGRTYFQIFCFDFAEILMKLSADYTVENKNFPHNILQKGMPFWSIQHGKSKLSADYTWKTNFGLQTFLVFYGRKTCLTKWKFFPNFPQIILWKVKIFCVLYCRKFQLPRREKILCKGLSPLPKLISGKKSTMGSQCYFTCMKKV